MFPHDQTEGRFSWQEYPRNDALLFSMHNVWRYMSVMLTFTWSCWCLPGFSTLYIDSNHHISWGKYPKIMPISCGHRTFPVTFKPLLTSPVHINKPLSCLLNVDFSLLSTLICWYSRIISLIYLFLNLISLVVS